MVLCLHFVADKVSTWSKLSRAEHWVKETQSRHWQQKWTRSIHQRDSFVHICKPALKVSICHLWSVNEMIRQQWTCTVGQTWLYEVDKCLHGCVKITDMHHSPHFPGCVAQNFSASWVFWCHLSHFTSFVVLRFWWLPTVFTEIDMQGQCM